MFDIFAVIKAAIQLSINISTNPKTVKFVLPLPRRHNQKPETIGMCQANEKKWKQNKLKLLVSSNGEMQHLLVA